MYTYYFKSIVSLSNQLIVTINCVTYSVINNVSFYVPKFNFMFTRCIIDSIKY